MIGKPRSTVLQEAKVALFNSVIHVLCVVRVLHSSSVVECTLGSFCLCYELFDELLWYGKMCSGISTGNGYIFTSQNVAVTK